MADGRQHVLVVYGGKSTEHDISRRSARQVLTHLDRELYHVHAVAIDQAGRWLPQNVESILGHGAGPLPIFDHPQEVTLSLPKNRIPRTSFLELGGVHGLEKEEEENVVVFPILHGTGGEDGTFQGFIQQADLAFVGPDTLGSAIGMDKVVSKKLAQAAGVPVVPWIDVRIGTWKIHGRDIAEKALNELELPIFVKPAQLGSSVGVTKVKHPNDLFNACESAFAYDDRILIEKGLDVREIEVALLGDYEPLISIPGEVIPHADYYSYDAKYIDSHGASMAIPALLEPAQVSLAQQLAKKVFIGLELYGMARVDLFLEKKSGTFYFNEVNTIPGFTEISQYPLLWKESGIAPKKLLTHLIDWSTKRHQLKRKLRRTK